MKDNITSLFEKNREKVFIIDARSDETFTYGRFETLVGACCEYLKQHGVMKGMKVAVCLPNGVDFAVLYFSAVYLGFTVVPLNPNFSLKELDFICRNSGVRMLVYSRLTERYIADVPALAALEKKLRVTVFGETTGDAGESGLCLSRCRSTGDTVMPAKIDGAHDDPFVIMYTSGTTGLPKGVAHRLSAMVDNALSFIGFVGISSDHRFYNVLSMSYMAGFYNLILLPFLAGASVVIGEVFNPQQSLDFWRCPIKYSVNILWLVPTIMSILLRLDRGVEGPDYCRRNVRLILVSTAPLPSNIKNEFERKYGILSFENYGLSETLFISTNTQEERDISGTVGRILPGCQAGIIGEDGGKLPVGAEGEISVKTNGTMIGYVDQQEGFIDKLPQGHEFKTGDVGYVSADGCLFITGRIKDLIIKGGVNVSPRAVEEVIHAYPAVETAAVVGVPNAVYGEDIVAIVKLKEGYDFRNVKAMLTAHCKELLSAMQRPSTFFEIGEMPMTVNGKINKKALRDIVLEKVRSLVSPDSTLPMQ